MKKYNLFLFGLLLIATLTNCKKDLNLNSSATYGPENSFTNLEDLEAGVNGAYGRYTAYANDMYVNALLSDESKLGADNGGQGVFAYTYQFGANPTSGEEVISAFGDYYYMLDQINRVLPYIESVAVPANQEARKSYLKGSLLALRAIAHFSLLEMYSKKYDPSDPLGIPYVKVSNPVGMPARNSVAETVANIEADLAEGKSLVTANSTAAFSDTVMNKINIAGYQARVALYKRDYDAAITFASEVISSNVKPLVSGATFKGIWNDANQSEILFRIRLLSSTLVGSLWTTTTNLVYISPSDKLTNSYASDDIRLSSYIGTNPAGNRYVNKFYESSRGGRMVDIKAMRTAEMYLIRAEAYARKATPDVAAGAADLNFLRANRIPSYTDETFTSATALADAVMEERFKELAFEGFRFFDLKRNSLPVQRLASDAGENWRTLPADNFRFTLPIPTQELDANPNMVPNPGY